MAALTFFRKPANMASTSVHLCWKLAINAYDFLIPARWSYRGKENKENKSRRARLSLTCCSDFNLRFLVPLMQSLSLCVEDVKGVVSSVARF